MKLLIDNSLPLIKELYESSDHELYFFDKSTQSMTQNVDVVICRAHSKINQSFFNGYHAALVATVSSGSDHLDKAWLGQQNVKWIDAIGSNARSVSDYVLHLLHHPNIPINGKKIGIIGVGHVGERLNKALVSLGFDTVLYDPPRAQRDATFQSQPIDALFQCGVISLHVPLNKEGPHKTTDLLNESFLSRCKPSGLIINTSRGEVIKENALLTNAHLRYCLDVYCQEPNINPSIIKQCLITTPHIAGHAIEAKQRAMLMVLNKILSFFNLTKSETPFDDLLTSTKTSLTTPLNLTYDPMHETHQLKIQPTAEQFISLRKAHTQRHELV